jgi:hypothetical protein
MTSCQGYCRCPECGQPAYWSPVQNLHRCYGCRHQFTEHNAVFDKQGRVVAPGQTSHVARPEGPWSSNG